MSSQLHLVRGADIFIEQMKTTLFQNKKKIGWKHTLPLNGGDENKGDGKENEGRELAHKF